MEILKHVSYRDVEVKVVRLERHTEQIVSSESQPLPIEPLPLAKKADRPERASYENKQVSVNTGRTGDISFGITISRS